MDSHKSVVVTPAQKPTVLWGRILASLWGLEWLTLRSSLITLLWMLPLAALGAAWCRSFGVAWAIGYGLILLGTTRTHVGIVLDAVRVALHRSPRVIPWLERESKHNKTTMPQALTVMPEWIKWVLRGVTYANPLWLTAAWSIWYVQRHQRTSGEVEHPKPTRATRTALALYYTVHQREQDAEGFTDRDGILVG